MGLIALFVSSVLVNNILLAPLPRLLPVPRSLQPA